MSCIPDSNQMLPRTLPLPDSLNIRCDKYFPTIQCYQKHKAKWAEGSKTVAPVLFPPCGLVLEEAVEMTKMAANAVTTIIGQGCD
jgi:hypothetical protein